MQSSAARSDRLSLGKERSREAAFLRSLPKETRKANRLASKTRNQVLGQRYRSGVNEGMTILRSNFGKRKGLTPGAADSINKSIQTSGRKMKAAIADPRPGRRLAKSRIGKERKPVALPRQSGVIAKPKGLKPQPSAKVATRKRPPLATRLAAFEGKLKAKTTAWQEEARKADNAFNRNNDVGWTAKAQKIADRRNKVTRQGGSLLKAARAFKQIDLMENPARYGYARGSAQRSRLAGQIKQERQSLRSMKAAAKRANTAYQESPVVKYGLTSEIGGNRRQGKKAKAAASNRLTSLADTAVATSITARKQEGKIAELRKSARTQTMLTNKLTRRRKPK
jgi:hypothetical protein